MFPGETPAQFFDEELVRLLEAGTAKPSKKADVIFEIVGPAGGRWCLHLGERSKVERVDAYARGQLLIRMDEVLFPEFLDGSLELVPAVEAGQAAVAGDLSLLEELARMWRAPLTMLELRSKKEGA